MTGSEAIRGSLIGLAVGDALGTTVEFLDPGSFEPVTDIVGGGPFGLPVGAWTDDTSMALCLAESIVETGGFDPQDQLQRYVKWWREGYMSSTGEHFDIGVSTAAALSRFEQTGEPFPGDAFPDAGGNGSLMRLAPVPLAWAGDPVLAIALSGDNARVTHGLRQGIDCCRYYGGLIVGAARGASKDELIGECAFHPTGREWETELHPEVFEVASGSFRTKEPMEIEGAGYAVPAMEAALWALASTESFEQGALTAVNLGDDADTTGAIYGQLAGAIYGLKGIPEHWVEKVVELKTIDRLSRGLFEMSQEEIR